MRNDTQKWDAPQADEALLSGGGVRISRLRHQRMLLVSGPLARTASPLPLVGWPDIAPEGPCAISLRRDRILEIDGPARSVGWDVAAGLAASDMSDGYTGYLLDGPGAMALLRQGAELSLGQPSASAARLVFGLPAILYRLSEQRFALIFTRAHATAGWTALRAHLGHLPTVGA